MPSFKSEITETEYASFYKRYIDLAPDLSVVEALQKSSDSFFSFFENLSDEQGLFKYAPDKWTLKELLLHCIDTERIMAYRALRFSRNDTSELAGFDQDEYVFESNANQRKIKDLLEEYQSVRKATLDLFTGFDSKVLVRFGIASGNRMSVRALGYVISGHELHHLEICKTRYILD
ncbi:MAG: DinB family protein [Flavobacteriaceae bacterium]